MFGAVDMKDRPSRESNEDFLAGDPMDGGRCPRLHAEAPGGVLDGAAARGGKPGDFDAREIEDRGLIGGDDAHGFLSR
jgi:hypothetical protein